MLGAHRAACNTMDSYHLVVGLEIHAELKTRTKMFCGCKNDPDETRPNINICPVCMGHPGTLPVINRQAVRHVLRVGAALGGTLADYTEFDRKNYFYPDIPKGYQISQYQYPLVTGGSLAGVAITRVHLEEDTASSQHDKGAYSLVDFNRAGVPLMELVTEPVIHTPAQAGAFARELQLLLRYLGASDANMEKGEMRVEANISVAPQEGARGTKVEVKNLNSFRAVERAIAYEAKRQRELLEKGEAVVQETRGWDENRQKTFSQRKKEASHDYRYFPDPDLPKLKLSELREFTPEAVRASLPELPWEARARLAKRGLSEEVAGVLVREPRLKAFFDAVTREERKPARVKLAANYLTSDVVGLIGEGVGSWEELAARTPEEFRSLIALLDEGVLSSRGAKEVLPHWLREGGDPRGIAARLGVVQESDPAALKEVVAEVLQAHPDVVADIKAGNEKAVAFLVGQGMRRTKGSANPALLTRLLREALGLGAQE